MTHSVVNTFIYENLQTVSQFNEHTRLCIYEPTHRLFIVKTADLSCKYIYEAIMSLSNPYLAKILYIAEKDDCIEIVREYISGETLADLMKYNKSLDKNTAVKIAGNICDGLADIHKLGYVHRDITPNNIIISSDGCTKIIDFGIARDFSQNKTSDTYILGTPGYAAPEQFGFSQSDARTDIYAVGVLLNVMLTGKMPNEQKPSGELGRIIKKCIEIDSAHRYKSINELKSVLYNKSSESNLLDRIIKHIPGIRSNHTLVVILASIGYICAAVFSVAIFATVQDGKYFQTIASWIFCFPIPYFCFHNFLNIWNKLPFSQGASKRNQRIVYYFLGFMSIFFGLILFGSANSQPM